MPSDIYKNARRDKRSEEDERRIAMRWYNMRSEMPRAKFAKLYGLCPGTLKKMGCCVLPGGLE